MSVINLDLVKDETIIPEEYVVYEIEQLSKSTRDAKCILDGLHDYLADHPEPEWKFSDGRLEELIRLHAPNTSAVNDGRADASKAIAIPDPPPELKHLVESGDAFYSQFTNGRPNHWMVKQCSVCHNFNRAECCGKTTEPVIAETYGEEGQKLTRAGRQAVGLEPIKTPKQKEAEIIKSWEETGWWKSFRGTGELAGSGTVEFLIEGFLMKGGVTFLGGSPEGGKSLVAMSIAKALSTGQPLFGKLNVVEACPILWLGAEGGDNGLKIRCKAFRITSDKRKFISRTLSQGMLGLDNKDLEDLVRQMRPVVILETAVRFGEGSEDSASDVKILAGSIFHLLTLGARAVVAIHHAKKNLKDTGISLESVLRGSSDFGAMCDVAIAVIRDEKAYRNGAGPSEIELIGCKGRDFGFQPIRLALTERAPDMTPASAMWRPGFVSCIDQTGDLKWVDKADRVQKAEKSENDVKDGVDLLIQADPAITVSELAQKTGNSSRFVRGVVRELGWTKPQGPNRCWEK